MAVRLGEAAASDDPNSLSTAISTSGSITSGIVGLLYDDTEDPASLVSALRVLEAAMLQDVG